ncbi:MAG: hypothetical protein ACR2HG_11695 [Pyrinomonadaceae bacterium]
MSAQTLRTDKDPRNIAPTVGTGGPVGGPTGLFTIYDGQTLRAGEFTFSVAWSNYDRDPGNVDINEIPVSFQAGVNDYIEVFFNTDAYRGVKVNSPRNLSSFYLPNSQLIVNGNLTNPPAIVLGTGAFAGSPVFRATQPFAQFPFFGSRSGVSSIGFIPSAIGGGSGSFGSAASFPGIGSVYGSILPGVVLQTNTITTANGTLVNPTSFTTAPSYLPDAPFINRTYGESSFNTFTLGAKIRFTGPNNPYGIGIIPFYRFYDDRATDFSGFNQLQRGSSPGASLGDFGAVLFGDARLSKHVNVSANIGYILNSSVKANFQTGRFTILDRPNEVLAGIGVDFPLNRYFQPIAEFRSTQYVGGRTPNAFENSPVEVLGGVRFFPTRYFVLGAAYRMHINQQDDGFFNNNNFTSSTTLPNGTVVTSTSNGIPAGFVTSGDPNGFIFQVAVGRRNSRKAEVVNKFADVTDLALNKTTVTNPCPPGFRPAEGQACSDDRTVGITTTAVDPENDVLTYNYTVSGGRIVGQGANVTWDLTGAQPGTYTITSGVDDGCGVCGKTQTRTITVADCNCIKVCDCPTLSVTGPPASVNAGDTITFTANVAGGSQSEVTYNWTTSAGTIIEGQGTPVVRVATTPDMAGGTVTGTVTIGGVCDECQKTASDTVDINVTPVQQEAIKVDEFGDQKADEIKARLDAFYIDLNNNPSDRGVIINYGTPKQIAKRESDIRKAITFRKYDASRVTFVRGGDQGTGVRTVFWRVPPGAAEPTP